MIVRIATEGQYELPDSAVEELNRLDNETVTACDGGSEEAFREAYERLLGYVRERGRRLGDDELASSELILPPPDVSREEAASDFHGEGLIPG